MEQTLGEGEEFGLWEFWTLGYKQVHCYGV